VIDAPGAAEPTRLGDPRLRALTLGLALTITLVASEALAVITILPVVSRELHGVGLYGWTTSAFFFGTMVGIVVAGTGVDRAGPALPFVAGLLLFAGGLAVATSAPSMAVLVVGRALQGLGGGAIPAIAYATIGRAYPEALRPHAFAVLSTAWVVPGLGAPAASAFVADRLGWRWVFGGLLPLVLAAGWLTIGPLRSGGAPRPDGAPPPDGTRSTGAGAPPAGIDPPPGSAARSVDEPREDAGGDATGTAPARLLSAVRVSVGSALMLAGVTSRSPLGLPLVAAGLAVGAGPLRRLLPAGTLRARPGVPAAVAARGLLTFAYFGADTFVPLSITASRGASTAMAGVAVSVSTVSWTTGSWTQARLAGRRPGRDLVTAGLTLVVLGVAGMAMTLFPAVPLLLTFVAWGVAGFGMGLAYSPIVTLVLAEAPPGRQGEASTAVQLADNLGVAFGSGIGGVAVAASVARAGTVTAGLAAAFAVAGTVGLVGVTVARRLPVRTFPRPDRDMDGDAGHGAGEP
jgi:MFS family permease